MITSPAPPHFISIRDVLRQPNGTLLVVPETAPYQQLPFSLSDTAARTLAEMLARHLSEQPGEPNRGD